MKFFFIFLLGGILLLLFVLFFSSYSVPVLMYHQIGNQNILLNVTFDNFKKQLDYLKKNGYKVISLSELIEGLRQKKQFYHKTVVITFDDGHKDNFTYAFPVLKKYNFPATVFLVTSKIDKDPNYLNWDNIREMHKNGIDFGCHTRNHVYLPDYQDNDEKLWEEIFGSKKDIYEKTGIVAKYFSYPIGGFSEKIKTMVKKAGYEGAVTTNRKSSNDPFDVFEIRRISVRNDNFFEFWWKVSGYYHIFRKEKRAY